MAKQYTTSQFTTEGGVLGLGRSAMSRVVARSTAYSTGDGDHGAQAPQATEPPEYIHEVDRGLKTMIDQRVHWKNDYGVPVEVQVQIQRARRTMQLSAPNYAFIRERYTTAVGVDYPTNVVAEEPDPSVAWNTEWGGGIDLGLESGKPRYGQYRNSTPESTLMLEPLRVEADESVDVRFRASLITPFLWWSGDLIESPVARMEAFHNTILVWAFPQPVAG